MKSALCECFCADGEGILGTNELVNAIKAETPMNNMCIRLSHSRLRVRLLLDAPLSSITLTHY